ncbi:ABC transporter permease YtrF precursor [Aquisphaera giovannonii]|uniref:ABC transporter permease YtrF n=1 Tax=Aquisphaera giovannonii TaxID=406548 RepID=A0A5B9WA47_9BACT|nr:FtsX-like permease family protein [Aquisphaera giovannonii]QEH37406.1 ABC transporter permease YtrF precursor [Aquisphaera giovannonii]
MKYLTYILRNARRNPIRSFLTVASTSICLFLMMILLAFFAINGEVSEQSRVYNRIITMNANGFAGMVPIARVGQVSAMEGVVAATPFSWYGGKYHDQVMPFAQFVVDADTVFTVMDEYTVPPDQLADFKANKDGAAIGRKLASDWNLKVGDPLPLKGDIYPVDMNLTVRAIYDGASNRDLRMCLFHYDYFDEAMKRVTMGAGSGGSLATSSARNSGNAGSIFIKCKSADAMASLCKKIDDEYRNSEYPTRTQTEEAFGKMFADMLGDLKNAIYGIGAAVVVSLLFVAGNAMAMAMRERTSEVAVLKAIGFSKGRVLYLVLTEAILVAGLGGALGALGCKFLCDYVDIARFTAGFLPFFYIPWNIALFGVAVSLFIGFVSGVFPAVIAANSSVIDGLRKVV